MQRKLLLVTGLSLIGAGATLVAVGAVILARGTDLASPLSVPPALAPVMARVVDDPDIPSHTSPRGIASVVGRKRSPEKAAHAFLPVIDQPDIEEKHRRIADETLRMMPAMCQGTLKSFYVRYDRPENRGMAGKSSMILAGNLPDDEFRALFMHEFTHVMDLGCLTGTTKSGASGFRDGEEIMHRDDPSVEFYRISWERENIQRTEARPEDFVSGYARWDAYEDLAETVVAYVLHHDALMELAEENPAIAAKAAWVETHLFPEPPHSATGMYAWSGKRPWDMTKLPYAWIGAATAARDTAI